MKARTILLLTSIVTGCTSTLSYRPYVGEQQDWQTAKGAFIDTTGCIPIVKGYPPAPYVVIGQIQFRAPEWMITSAITQACKQRDADAILVDTETSQSTGGTAISTGFATKANGTAIGSGSSVIIADNKALVTATLIQFKDRSFVTNYPCTPTPLNSTWPAAGPSHWK